MTCGIYRITNTINGKAYIGQSVDIEGRWKQHISQTRDKFAIGNAIDKYGIDNFSFDIIARCPAHCLDTLEIVFIRELGTLTPDGYNISVGGAAFMKGRKFTDEHKQKISKGNKGKKRTSEMNERQSRSRQSLLNSPQGDVIRKRISDATKGHTRGIGRKLSEEQKSKVSTYMKGRYAGGLNPAAKPITYDGLTYGCKTDLARHLGISRKLLDYRIKKGIVEVTQ